MRAIRFVVCATFAVVLATSQRASSQSSDEPSLDQHVSHRFRIEALGGVGFGNVRLSSGETVNSYGPSLCGRIAYRLPFAFHIGLRYDYFFGTTVRYPYPMLATTKYATGAAFLGPELGYELLLPHAFVRPHIGLGLGQLRRKPDCSPVDGSFGSLSSQLCTEVSAAESSGRSSHFSTVPGLTMAVRFGRMHVFAEPRYYFQTHTNAFAIFGGLGGAL